MTKCSGMKVVDDLASAEEGKEVRKKGVGVGAKVKEKAWRRVLEVPSGRNRSWVRIIRET